MTSVLINNCITYINNDFDFEEILRNQCGNEVADWFQNYALQYGSAIDELNELYSSNLKLMEVIDKNVELMKKAIEKIYSMDEIQVSDFKNFESIRTAIEAIANHAEDFDRVEQSVDKNFKWL